MPEKDSPTELVFALSVSPMRTETCVPAGIVYWTGAGGAAGAAAGAAGAFAVSEEAGPLAGAGAGAAVLPEVLVAGAGCVAAFCSGAGGGVLLLQPAMNSNTATDTVRTGDEILIFCMAHILDATCIHRFGRLREMSFCHLADLL